MSDVKIEYGENGYLSTMVTSNAIVSFADPEAVPSRVSTSTVEPATIGNITYVPWFTGNNFPETAINLIDQNDVLTRATIMRAKTTLGQGVFPARLLSIDPDGREQLEVVKDLEVVKSFQNSAVNLYLAKGASDLNRLGNVFVKFIPNLAGNQLLSIRAVNARHVRIGVADPKTGIPLECYTTGNWAEPNAKDIQTFDLLDPYDPLSHLRELQSKGKLKKPVMMQLKTDFSNNDYYALPEWYAAKKWVDIGIKVAELIDAGMNNMLNLYIHLKIPYSYWDKKYPESEFKTKKAWREKVEEDLKLITDNLTSVGNAKKTLVSLFGDCDDGVSDKWELDVIEKKFNPEDVITSTAADTHTAIGAGIMPDLLGLLYGNSKGGSMQRELLLIQYALSWTERQKLADPLELMLKFNYGDKFADVQVKFRNTFLTPLDSGSETQTTAA